MRTSKRYRSSIGKRLAAWTAIVALVIQVALPSSTLAAAEAGTREDASLTQLVICTADGRGRVVRADPRTEPALPVSGAQTPGPVCFAAQCPMTLPVGVSAHAVGTPVLARRETMPRPPCRVVASPARAPPQSA